MPERFLIIFPHQFSRPQHHVFAQDIAVTRWHEVSFTKPTRLHKLNKLKNKQPVILKIAISCRIVKEWNFNKVLPLSVGKERGRGQWLIEIRHQKGIEHASFKIEKFSFPIDPSRKWKNLNRKKFCLTFTFRTTYLQNILHFVFQTNWRRNACNPYPTNAQNQLTVNINKSLELYEGACLDVTKHRKLERAW